MPSVLMSADMQLRGASYKTGETYEVPNDHAAIIVAAEAGEIIVTNEPEDEKIEGTGGEGDGAAERDEIDAAVMAAEAGAAAPAEDAPAEIATETASSTEAAVEAPTETA